MLNIGLDEAGRGSLLGDLVVGIVICTPEQEAKLKEFGVKDSKKITPIRREKLYDIIKENCKIADYKTITSEEIDQMRNDGKTLNEIELDCFMFLCEKHKTYFEEDGILYLDSVDVKPENACDSDILICTSCVVGTAGKFTLR